MRWTAADERRHDAAPGAEGWGFEFGADVGARGGVRLTIDAAHARAAFVADFVVPGRGRVVVADEHVAVPRLGVGLEIRADGLWASLHCETAFEHWSLGLEAFGLLLDDGDDLAGSWDELRGERLPVGADLEWEGREPPEPLVDGPGYAQRGVMIGELLVPGRVPVEAPAVRDHWWAGPWAGQWSGWTLKRSE